MLKISYASCDSIPGSDDDIITFNVRVRRKWAEEKTERSKQLALDYSFRRHRAKIISSQSNLRLLITEHMWNRRFCFYISQNIGWHAKSRRRFKINQLSTKDRLFFSAAPNEHCLLCLDDGIEYAYRKFTNYIKRNKLKSSKCSDLSALRGDLEIYS